MVQCATACPEGSFLYPDLIGWNYPELGHTQNTAGGISSRLPEQTAACIWKSKVKTMSPNAMWHPGWVLEQKDLGGKTGEI